MRQPVGSIGGSAAAPRFNRGQKLSELPPAGSRPEPGPRRDHGDSPNLEPTSRWIFNHPVEGNVTKCRKAVTRRPSIAGKLLFALKLRSAYRSARSASA